MMLLLQSPLFLHILLAWLLHKEGSVAHNGLGVLLACNDNLVDGGFPERLHHHSRVAVFVEGVPVDLTEGAEVGRFVLLGFLNDADLNFSLLDGLLTYWLVDYRLHVFTRLTFVEYFAN